MPGLYTALHGVNPMALDLLTILGFIGDGHIPRFRDCYLDAERKRICIHTRTGGGNRAQYEKKLYKPDPDTGKTYTGPWNDDLRGVPGFISDEDMEFDTTYATFYYHFPDKYADLLTLFCKDVGHVDTPEEKWKTLFAKLKDGSANK